MGRPRGRPKGSRNKPKPVWRGEEISPFDYLKGVLNRTEDYSKERFEAACALMPFIYPKLSASKIDATLKDAATGEQITDADRLVDTVLTVKADAPNGHAKPNGANGSGNGAT
jgi:hypothetical protein